MGVIPWSPFAGGWLTDPNSLVRFDAVEGLSRVANAAGLSLTHMSLAFVNEHPAITSTIIGPKTMEQLDDLVGGADVTLDSATLDAIDGVVKPGRDMAGITDLTGNPSLSKRERRTIR
jgi:aryl-alcohol dehydrogenase-like predicted oxidoreductase